MEESNVQEIEDEQEEKQGSNLWAWIILAAIGLIAGIIWAWKTGALGFK